MSEKRIVYICGPISAPTGYEQEWNIRRAETAFVRLARAGIPAICPHLHGRFLDGVVSHEEWLALDLPLLELCTDLVLLDGWEESAGSQIEYEHALSRCMHCWALEEFLQDIGSAE